MAKPREGPSKEMAREVARVCVSLQGCVRLEPALSRGSKEGAPTSPPVPRIVVHFDSIAEPPVARKAVALANDENKAQQPRAHVNSPPTKSNRNPKAKASPPNAANACHTASPINVCATLADTPVANAAVDNTDTESTVQQAVRAKLEAVRFLAAAASCAEFSWRGNPRFWRHVLSQQSDAFNCEPFFDLPREARRSAIAFGSEPPVCAPATCAPAVTELPEFLLDFSNMPITPELLALCARVLSPAPQFEPQSEPQGGHGIAWSREKLLAMTRATKPESKTKPTLKVMVGLRLERCQLQDTGLQGLELTLGAIRGYQREPGSTVGAGGAMLQLTRLELRGMTLSSTALGELVHLLTNASSAALQELLLRDVLSEQTSVACMTSFNQLMTVCFDLRPPVNGPSDRVAPLKRLSLADNLLSTAQLASLFSAVRAGGLKAVQELSLAGCFTRPDMQSSSLWKWLAFGVFNCSSRSRLIRLDLSSNVLRGQDVLAVQKLLQSDDCGSQLLSKPRARGSKGRGRSTRPRRVLLVGGTRLERPRDRQSREPASVAFTIPTSRWFHLLQRERKWSVVLEPGYGQLWVSSSRIERVEEQRASSQEPKDRSLQSLAMNAIKTTGTVLKEQSGRFIVSRVTHTETLDRVLTSWVHEVGSSLRTLELRSNAHIQGTLAEVFSACPRLLHLDVEGCELAQVRAVTEAFQRGRSRLQTLNLTDNCISSDSQIALLRVLADVNCASARELRALYLENNPPGRDNSVAKELRPMLTKNKTLRLLTLTVDAKRDAQGMLRYRVGKSHCDEWLGWEPLPLASRLALLSVPVAKTLSTDALQLVFGFAGQDIYRQIQWK